jgi:cytochrome c oxidase subunit II
MMFASIDTVVLPPQASEFASEYDIFFWYITAVITLGAGVVFAMITASCYLYARKTPTDKTPRILGSNKAEFIWTFIPFLFFMSFFVWGVKVYNDEVSIPQDAPEYFVAGKQWMWKLQHPDGTREINELHIPVCDQFDASGHVTEPGIKMTGTSEDVIHDFGVPAFRSKFDVVPGRYFSVGYKPTKIGTYHIFCDQYCGQGHSQMVGKIHVLSKADYESWKQGVYRKEGKNPVDGSPAWEGRKLFLKLQCNSCHNNEAAARAPQLAGMHGQMRPLEDGTLQKFDDEYIKQSIRNPMAKQAAGWALRMPAYPLSQVDEIELRNLTAYIKSLKPTDRLPDRTEMAPAPVGAPMKPSANTPNPTPPVAPK